MSETTVRYSPRYGKEGPDGSPRACSVCGGPLSGQRAMYCSNSCRQLGYRRRRQAPAAPPPRLPPDLVVYQCPRCEARYLGEQRCEDCNLWCHRLGPGAECPHCGQPVAVADLDLSLLMPSLKTVSSRATKA